MKAHTYEERHNCEVDIQDIVYFSIFANALFCDENLFPIRSIWNMFVFSFKLFSNNFSMVSLKMVIIIPLS